MKEKSFEELISEELMILRRDAHISLEELAQKTNIAISTLSKYENNKVKMFIPTITKIINSYDGMNEKIFFTRVVTKS